jgi:AcrR family transcriptional regulator
MERKTDPRVIRTRQMLRDALIALILEQGYDAISIQDITDKAGLRRATFYLHYKDKDELLFSVLRDTFDELVVEMEKIHPYDPTNGKWTADHFFSLGIECQVNVVIFRHVQQNAALYRSIFNGRGAATITNFILAYLIDRTNKEVLQTELEFHMPKDVYLAYTSTVRLNMAIWWLNAGTPYSPEEMAEYVAKLTLNGEQIAYSAKAPSATLDR